MWPHGREEMGRPKVDDAIYRRTLKLQGRTSDPYHRSIGEWIGFSTPHLPWKCRARFIWRYSAIWELHDACDCGVHVKYPVSMR